MTWDDEVDVICLGGVAGTLASAVVAVDADVEVFVATSSAPGGTWLGSDVTDAETLDYFAALTADLGPVEPPSVAEVPMRVVQEAPRDESRGRKVATFFGSRLNAWAAQCLSSPYGLLHTRVTDWGTTGMRTLEDKPVQVKIVGTMSLASGEDAPSLIGWLCDEADARGINIHTDTTLDRLVFEDGVVIGAMLNTPDGPYALGARHGVTLAPAVPAGDTAVVADAEDVQIGLVSQTGSRFARVEVLMAATPAPVSNGPCQDGPRVTTTLRDSRRNRSQSRRGRKVDRYPPFGE
ncbi:hypothetical protein A5757_14780 [Mycobacterium sp. 852013-51886_SCH5428379]|uniref:hypothetical protein n=1 Tax=Mycobacterium sp. 852013-51886_SCH5428379 TaxID=1834111 RepID=UPI0007FE88A8|nr:hypothetical protein [Mycobacterium sp. 852013-51886_SCH5428379]OBB59219.1 hypothetical protein A5757_14780 [Mycobacterium sp. 852013-51886_SCH5428379]